ncbi:DUF397 domain-containing protein [Nonomuraea sp. NPDC050556]|uniref:DUF397 domain-containing protein n=1 Tax=Nonomuraea sp. NPDC050556 TaxID=3364369 RepID=UPI0037B09582
MESAWRKSTWSDGSGGGCVSVADLGDHCAVRDSVNPGPYFVVSKRSWRAFVAMVRQGAFGAPVRPERSDGM